MASTTLIDAWCEQLRETEALIEHGSPSLRWLRLAYARLYRFLLSAYGVVPVDPAERERATAAAEQSGDTRLAVDGSVDFQGKRARTTEEIGAALKSVHAAQSEVEAGPLARGLGGADWIRILSVRGRTLWDEVDLLTRAGIPAQMNRVGGETVLEVPYSHRIAARELLDKWAAGEGAESKSAPESARRTVNRHSLIAAWILFLTVLLGGVMGTGALVLSYVDQWWAWGLAAGAIVAFLVSSACMVRWQADNASE